MVSTLGQPHGHNECPRSHPVVVQAGHAYSWGRMEVSEAALDAVAAAAAATLQPTAAGNGAAPADDSSALAVSCVSVAPAAPEQGQGAILDPQQLSGGTCSAGLPDRQPPPGASGTGVFADECEDDCTPSKLRAAGDDGGPDSSAHPAVGGFQDAAATASTRPPPVVPSCGGAGRTAVWGNLASSAPAGVQQAVPAVLPPPDLAAQLLAAGVSMRQFKEGLPIEVDYGHIRLALAHLGHTQPAVFAAQQLPQMLTRQWDADHLARQDKSGSSAIEACAGGSS